MTNETSAEVQWPNIYIVGAQSTGKTTLVDGLVSFIKSTCPDIPHPVVIREVARDVLKEHHFSRDEIRSSQSRTFELQKLILEKQSTAERDAPSSWIISDRSGIDPIVYAKQFAGDVGMRRLKATSDWKWLSDRMKKS